VDNGDQEPTDELNWHAVGQEAVKHLKRTPTISFMYGPLEIEQTVVRKERQRREREKIGEKVVPEEVKDTQMDQEALEKATSKRVEDLRGYLEKAKQIDFVKFVVDPQSFSQTVENIFHYSFLIKDGQAAFKLDDKGIPIAEPAQPPLQEDYTSGKAERRQCVVAINQDMWKKLKEKYEIKTGYLPHRTVGTYNLPRSNEQSTVVSSPQKSKPKSKQNGHTKKQVIPKTKNSKREVEESSEEDILQESEVETTPPSSKKRLRKQVVQSSSSEEEEDNLNDKRKKQKN